jgi:hypothetical protein
MYSTAHHIAPPHTTAPTVARLCCKISHFMHDFHESFLGLVFLCMTFMSDFLDYLFLKKSDLFWVYRIQLSGPPC